MIYGFRLHRPIQGGLWDSPYNLTAVGSGTITMGDVIKEGTGTGCDAADAVTDQVSAVCTGFVDKDGIPYDVKTGGFTTVTYTEAVGGDTIVTNSANFTSRTTATYGIQCVVYSVYNFLLSAREDATLGTNTGSGTPGYYLSILTTDSTKLDESSATTSYDADATAYQIRKLDPMDSTRVIVSVIMTEVAAD